MKSFWLAWQLLTRFPAPQGPDFSETDATKSLSFYPLIGALIGCLIAGILWVGQSQPIIASIVAISAYVMSTGALHIDGLADTADGWLGGHGNTKRTLEIMRDSQTGVAGVVAIGLLLLGYFAALSQLSVSIALGVVFLWAFSRWLAVGIMLTTQSVSASSLAGEGHNSRATYVFWLHGLGIMALATAILGSAGLLALIIQSTSALLLRLYGQRRLGGHSGDLLGATIEISQWTGMLTLVWVVS